MKSLAEKETQIISGLKDFQRATVERVFDLFKKEHNRVLVADEVGLGKTLIAKGVIAKTALYHMNALHDDLFKVVYVCSNQSIVAQNLSKLKIDETDRVDSLADTRLSMQHLKIFEDEIVAKDRDNYIQLIPLTPSTSFNMTGGSGSVQERALMYAILRRYKELSNYSDALNVIMMDSARQSWNVWARDLYEQRVSQCDQDSGGDYLRTVLDHIDNYFAGHDGLLDQVIDFCEMQQKTSGRQSGSYQIIHQLRRMMAEISIELLDADLVIMDEFQRFPELVRTDADDENTMLARRFFNTSKRDDEKVKILLLSATPYKLYSTLEEINENQADEHYREFMQVSDFLFETDPVKKTQFREVWNDYSLSLSEIGSEDLTVLTVKKKKAEDALYQGICRTERLAVDGADRFIDIQTTKSSLEVGEDDILSFVQADRLLGEIGFNDHVPVEYVKSAPFIFSFMEHYKLKARIVDYFKKNPKELRLARKYNLWVNEDLLARYEKIPNTNARLKRLNEEALPKGAENLLWIPPSLPYYEPSGPFSRIDNFSKVLVFSSWEMVPRAIAVMLSYEAERLTIGKLGKRIPNPENDNRGYFPRKGKVRFPRPRLKFSIREDNSPENMALMCLLYPSKTLAELFNPIACLNSGHNRKQIEADLKTKIETLLGSMTFVSEQKEGVRDERWYYIAPLLLDRNEKAIRNWLNQSLVLEENIDDFSENEQEDDRSALAKHFKHLNDILNDSNELILGKKPPDLMDILVKMTMASPAICALRLFGSEYPKSPLLSVRLAKRILDRFNLPESTSIVELYYGSNGPHWKKVLSYCRDGNIQAMLDEYAHILIDDNGLVHVSKDKGAEILCERMGAAMRTQTASYNVDTYSKFKDRINKGDIHVNGGNKGERRFIKMRSGYAAGFYDMKGADKSQQRKENLRLAFNSPFRPFVLATTSIGQEGLDFHFYCRKIVHWNLPSNPIDLEQREGRINRYKCLAIRQNVANKYGKEQFKEDVWNEMFAKANKVKTNEMCSELVPFWCLPDDISVKIERIVPMYPLSKDQAKYERLIKILSLYRLSLGQARQEELLEYVLQSGLDATQIKELFINLSPYFKELA
jgi:hypothetical protein